MTPGDYIIAARVPQSVRAETFGLWQIFRQKAKTEADQEMLGPFTDMTVLARCTLATMHLPHGEVVMEDSWGELVRHLPIWLRARGKVLVTGLGLGCVVRGLLHNPAVERVTVVEIDGAIIKKIWPEFRSDERLLLQQGDARQMEWPPGTHWDYGWHDIWQEDKHVAPLHAALMMRYADLCDFQGGWGMPRWVRDRFRGAIGIVDG